MKYFNITVNGKTFHVGAEEISVRTTAQPTPVLVATPAATPAKSETVANAVAPGSAGRLKLYDTPPKTAAMLMAIVADKLGTPLNELRFISIKEVK